MSDTPLDYKFEVKVTRAEYDRLVACSRELAQAKTELAAVRADTERLDAIEKNMWFVEPDYSLITPVFRVGKVNEKSGKPEHSGRRLRDAIDSAREQQAEGRGEG